MAKKVNITSGLSNEEQEQIEFPVSYEIKIIVTLKRSVIIIKDDIENLFHEVKTPYKFLYEKDSKKGTYTSLTYQITLLNKPHMDELYSGLNKIEDIKMAI
ncbi:MAG: DUF493 domain-containing protein [Bacteroidales bacterium]|jgi:putative lipoic acid-binding regulatory protein|nr:DUF493 domain-containing protein [Bacteroidales bacterium]